MLTVESDGGLQVVFTNQDQVARCGPTRQTVMELCPDFQGERCFGLLEPEHRPTKKGPIYIGPRFGFMLLDPSYRFSKGSSTSHALREKV